MRYADWKNDFTFYRLFGDHEDVLRDLLNDLMELNDEQAIAALEYLHRDQAPQLPGGRRAIVLTFAGWVHGLANDDAVPRTEIASRRLGRMQAQTELIGRAGST